MPVTDFGAAVINNPGDDTGSFVDADHVMALRTAVNDVETVADDHETRIDTLEVGGTSAGPVNVLYLSSYPFTTAANDTDRRAAFADMLSDAAAATQDYYWILSGGAKCILDVIGAYGMNGAYLDVPNKVDVEGLGSNYTRLQFTAAGSGLRVGDNVTQSAAGSDHVHGRIGGFGIDGTLVANRPFVLGLGAGCAYFDIRIIRAAQDGLALLGHQNATFTGLEISDCARDGIVFDRGAGGNQFFGVHVARCGRDFVRFTQTAAKGAGVAYAQPENNVFWGGLIEYEIYTGSTQMTGSAIYHGAGLYNRFVGTRIGSGFATSAMSLVKMRQGAEYGGATELSGYLSLCSLELVGVTAYTTAFDLTGTTNLVLEGRITVAGALRAFYLADAPRVNVRAASLQYFNVTSHFVNQGGTFGADTLIVGLGLPSKAGIPTDADFAIVQDGVEMIDRTNIRHYIRVAGVMRYVALT